METSFPITRVQQIIGIPEHPCEAIIRNGVIICPYEEMDVRFTPEHAGLFLATYIGEENELFGGKNHRAKASLCQGYLPIVTHKDNWKHCNISQTVFACLIEGKEVKDGTEPLVCMVQLQVENITDETICLPVTLYFGSCFRPQNDKDEKSAKDYWTNFLKRNDISCDFSEQGEPYPYSYTLNFKDKVLFAQDRGVVFVTDYSGGYKPAINENGDIFGLIFELSLKPNQCEVITYKLPYYPLDEKYLPLLKNLSYDEKLKEVTENWEMLLNGGSQISVPGTNLNNLWRAQTAYTFMLVDKQNKGSDKLFGKEVYEVLNAQYPDKVLCYTHLSPSLYEFIWAQEAAFWVIGMLDKQGYHNKAEEYLELFFELQGKGIPGVYNKDILPDTSSAVPFMGTTPHSWLNSTGGVLSAIADHYWLTRDKNWINKHKSSILFACKFIQILRNSTKSGEYLRGYGIMPAGQSTDCTFSSEHLQWYYTDIGTLRGLSDIVKVMKECMFDEYEEMKKEYDEYRICLLKSLDASILDVEDFMDDESQYDFSPYRFAGAMEDSLITEFNENGVPKIFEGKVITKKQAIDMGLKGFLPMGPLVNIPLKIPYLDNLMPFSFGMLSGIVDFSSETPMFERAKHNGKQVWELIRQMAQLYELFDDEKGIYSRYAPYNDYIAKKMLDCDETDKFADIIRYVEHYDCDPETHVMLETIGNNQFYFARTWFQPCPFSLVMATFRGWLQNAFIYVDEKQNTLVIGKALLKEWIENSITFEEPIMINRACTKFGKISVKYDTELIFEKMKITVQFDTLLEKPAYIEICVHHPQNKPILSVKYNGVDYKSYNSEKGIIFCEEFIFDGENIFEVSFSDLA